MADVYPESEQQITKAEAASRMHGLSLDLMETINAMLAVYELRPALNVEQPEVTTEVFAASLDEWTALAACLAEDWRMIADVAERIEAEAQAAAQAAADPEPETRRVVVLSTAHLTEATCEMLRTTPLAEWPVAGAPLVHGFYVYVHDCDANEHPADLEACFAWARGRFDYIQFDCDADARPDIPSYY